MMQNITDFLQNNKQRLVLIVHPDIQRLDDTKKLIQTGFEWPAVSIGNALSADMLSGQVSGVASVQAWLIAQIRNLTTGSVLLNDIDFLFEPTFKLNPLVLFQQTSRLIPLVVLWPGTYSDNKVLSYAIPEHQHYRTWRNPEANIFTL